MFRTLLITIVSLATFAPIVQAGEKVDETCFGRRRQSESAMAAFAQRVLAQQQAQIVEAKVANEILLQSLQVQTRTLENVAEIKGFMYAKGQQAAAPPVDQGQIQPAYRVPAPTAPYTVPPPTAPYVVPAPTSPYTVPPPTAPYPIPAPTAPYTVPGPSYEFRLQSPSAPSGQTPGQPAAPSGGLNVPSPGGVTPLQPIPSPTSARSVAWSKVRR